MSLKEEQLSAIKTVYESVMSLSVCPLDLGRASATKLCRLFVVEQELGGDRAVIIVSLLSSCTSVLNYNIGTDECLCRDMYI